MQAMDRSNYFENIADDVGTQHEDDGDDIKNGYDSDYDIGNDQFRTNMTSNSN